MKNTYNIEWSSEAIKNLKDILGYLKRRWTEKEVFEFSRKLDKLIFLICQNPEMFPESSKQKLRKAVLAKQTAVYYKVIDDKIYLVSLFITKRNPRSLKL